MKIKFDIISEIYNIETIAINHSIFVKADLISKYGLGKWRKMKGFAYIKLKNGIEHYAEIHWYEAHGIGKRDFKIKEILE